MSMGADVSFSLNLPRRREVGAGREDSVSVITIWAQRERFGKGALAKACSWPGTRILCWGPNRDGTSY